MQRILGTILALNVHAACFFLASVIGKQNRDRYKLNCYSTLTILENNHDWLRMLTCFEFSSGGLAGGLSISALLLTSRLPRQ